MKKSIILICAIIAGVALFSSVFVFDPFKLNLSLFKHNLSIDKTENVITQINVLNYTKEYTSNFKTNNLEFYEMIRYIAIKYFINSERNNNLNISELINDYRWLDINEILIKIIRPWYKNFNIYFESVIYNYIEEREIYYIYFFIIQFVLVSLYYWIIWKKYENEFFDLIKKSFDLINLIPEDLKDIIVNKLNEPN